MEFSKKKSSQACYRTFGKEHGGGSYTFNVSQTLFLAGRESRGGRSNGDPTTDWHASPGPGLEEAFSLFAETVIKRGRALFLFHPGNPDAAVFLCIATMAWIRRQRPSGRVARLMFVFCFFLGLVRGRTDPKFLQVRAPLQK